MLKRGVEGWEGGTNLSEEDLPHQLAGEDDQHKGLGTGDIRRSSSDGQVMR